MKQIFTLILCLFCAHMSVINAQTTPKKIASVEGITEYQLENGLKVLLFPDQSKQTITVNVTYLVGSRHEAYGETGMAHLLEHLVFKGTPNHPDIPKELSDHGAQPNGTTFYDRTNYFETFAATDENLEWAIDLEADRMINSFISADDLESEMTVVRNEFEAGENYPTSVLWKRMTMTAFSWHNYGNPTIGARADIENVPIDRLQAFYKKYYQPDNAVLLVAGKIDEEKTLDLINQYFGVIPRPERKLIPTYTKEPTQDGERFVELKRKGDVQAVGVIYKVPSGLHKDDAALSVLTTMMTDEPSGRLYKNLVESKKASSQYGFHMSLKEPGYVFLQAEVLKENSLEDAEKTMLATLDSLTDDPPTAEEVERAKAKILKNLELFMTNTEQIGLQMSEFIGMGDWRMMFINRDRIEMVTPEEVQNAAKTYFMPSNRTVGKFIPLDQEPTRVEIPDAPSIATLVTDYKGREVMDQGEAFDPSPTNIESRTVKGKLSNGMEYSLLTKDTKGNIIEGIFGFRFGSAESLAGKQIIAELTPQMLMKGTQSKSYQDIKDLLDKWKTQLQVYGNKGKTFFNFKTTRENLDNVLGLLEELVKEPSFPESEFEVLIQEQIASIEQTKSEPQSVAIRELNRYLKPYNSDHINYTYLPDEKIEQLKAVTLEDLKAYHAAFYGASNASAVLVGDFDSEPAIEALENAYGSWESPIVYNRVGDEIFEVEAKQMKFETPDKANAFFFAMTEMPLSDEDADYAALYVANYLMGGGFLNSRLATRIRQEEGLSYGVGSFFSADALDGVGTFGAYAIYAPENLEALEAAFKDEINKAKKEGFSQEELDAAKTGILQSNQVNRSKDQSLKTVLNNNLVFGRGMEYVSTLEDRISNLSLDDINAAFDKYISYENLTIMKAGDFGKVVEKP